MLLVLDKISKGRKVPADSENEAQGGTADAFRRLGPMDGASGSLSPLTMGLRVGTAVLSIVVAIFLYYALPQGVRGIYAFPIPILPLFAFACCWALLERQSMLGFPKPSKAVPFACAALLIAAAFCAGARLGYSSSSAWSYIAPVLAALVIAVPLSCAISLLFEWIERRRCRVGSRERSKPSDALSAMLAKRVSWLIVWALLLLFWLPVFLAAYPGFFCYDAGDLGEDYELNQFVSGRYFGQHSVLHMLFMGSVIMFGNGVFGNINAGVALFIGLQALMVAGVFSFMLKSMFDEGAPLLLVVFSFAYLALDPIIQMFALCSTKDVLFTAAALLLIIQTYRLLIGKGSLVKCIIWAAFALLFCMLRNNAMVAFVPFAIILIVVMRKRSDFTLMIGSAVVVVALSIVWYGPMYQLLGVGESEAQDAVAYSLPTQQMNYAYSVGALTDDEMRMLADDGFYFPEAEEYKPNNADEGMLSTYFMTKADFAKDYIAIGLAHPLDYLVGAMKQTEDAWNPYSYIDAYNPSSESSSAEYLLPASGRGSRSYESIEEWKEDFDYDHTETSVFECRVETPAYLDSKLPGYFDFLFGISRYLELQGIPILGLLVSIPAYMIFFVLAFAFSIARKDVASMMACLLVALMLLTVIVGPCVLIRYYLILFFGLPIIVFALIGRPRRAGSRQIVPLGQFKAI